MALTEVRLFTHYGSAIPYAGIMNCIIKRRKLGTEVIKIHI